MGKRNGSAELDGTIMFAWRGDRLYTVVHDAVEGPDCHATWYMMMGWSGQVEITVTGRLHKDGRVEIWNHSEDDSRAVEALKLWYPELIVRSQSDQ